MWNLERNRIQCKCHLNAFICKTHSSFNRKFSIRRNEIDRFICTYLLMVAPLHHKRSNELSSRCSKDRMSPHIASHSTHCIATHIFDQSTIYILICLLQTIVCALVVVVYAIGAVFKQPHSHLLIQIFRRFFDGILLFLNIYSHNIWNNANIFIEICRIMIQMGKYP